MNTEDGGKSFLELSLLSSIFIPQWHIALEKILPWIFISLL